MGQLNSPVFVAGHRGLVGSAIVRSLQSAGFTKVLTAGRSQVDLRNQASVNSWFEENRPEYVYLVAGTVGGIQANATRPAEFLYDNVMIAANVVEASRVTGVTKLLYLGSSCIYPREAAQPIVEDALLSGPLETTNEGYSVAKIAGMKLCEFFREQYGCDFITAMPTNLYGPGDNFDLENSHVLPALMRKFHDSIGEPDPVVTVWGTGTARREFLHVEDLAEACRHLMDSYSEAGHVNVGTGIDLTIDELATTIRDVVNPQARLEYDTSKPDGTPRKVLDVSRLTATGWTAKTSLRTGIETTYGWFLNNINDLRGVA